MDEGEMRDVEEVLDRAQRRASHAHHADIDQPASGLVGFGNGEEVMRRRRRGRSRHGRSGCPRRTGRLRDCRRPSGCIGVRATYDRLVPSERRRSLSWHRAGCGGRRDTDSSLIVPRRHGSSLRSGAFGLSPQASRFPRRRDARNWVVARRRSPWTQGQWPSRGARRSARAGAKVQRHEDPVRVGGGSVAASIVSSRPSTVIERRGERSSKSRAVHLPAGSRPRPDECRLLDDGKARNADGVRRARLGWAGICSTVAGSGEAPTVIDAGQHFAAHETVR